MKLFCDMLIPYMPDSVTNEKGELVPDNVKAAGRKAMMQLSEYQNKHNVLALYQAVLYGCMYAQVDLVDTILDTLDMDCDSPVMVDTLFESSVKSLFRSIKPGDENKLDIKEYVSNLLTLAHFELNRPRVNDIDAVEEGKEE